MYLYLQYAHMSYVRKAVVFRNHASVDFNSQGLHDFFPLRLYIYIWDF